MADESEETQFLSDEEKINEKVTKYLDETLGNDISKLKKVQALLKQSEAKKKALEKRLNEGQHTTPAEIQGTLDTGRAAVENLKTLKGQKADAIQSADKHSQKIKPLAEQLSHLANKVADIERFRAYISWIQEIEAISNQIQHFLDDGMLGSAVEQFSILAAISNTLKISSCQNLKGFAANVQEHWYNILVTKLSSEFDDVTKALKWPFTSMSTAPPLSTSSDTFGKLERIFILLLKLQDFKQADADVTNSEERSIPLPLDWLLRPLRKRFRFHFYGKKQTNNLEKPEWYFTQILNWIKSHGDFLQHTIQPILDKADLSYVDAKLEFIRGLLTVTTEKMDHSLPELLTDEGLFAHFVDETLLFHKELHTLYNYPLADHSCLKVLTSPQCLAKWVELERKYATENMECLLAADTAWTPKYEDIGGGGDDTRTTECAEGFVTLLTVITDRYRYLPGRSDQLKFLEVQLDLLKDFVIQLSLTAEEKANDPTDACFISVLNTTNYIAFLLEDWADQTLFLQLHEQWCSEDLDVDDGSSGGGVFDEPLRSLQELHDYMMSLVIEHVVQGFRAKCKPYKKERWHSLPSQKDLAVMALSSGACDMLLYLKDQLVTLQHLMAVKLFSVLWKDLAHALNKVLYEQVILDCHFNDGGAAQLQFDMTKNLFTLFGEYTQKPENYFKEVKECCILLNQMPGSAILLMESLKTASTDDDVTTSPQATLNEMGVYKLTPQDALRVLNLRINWPKT